MQLARQESVACFHQWLWKNLSELPAVEMLCICGGLAVGAELQAAQPHEGSAQPKSCADGCYAVVVRL